MEDRNNSHVLREKGLICLFCWLGEVSGREGGTGVPVFNIYRFRVRIAVSDGQTDEPKNTLLSI